MHVKVVVWCTQASTVIPTDQAGKSSLDSVSWGGVSDKFNHQSEKTALGAFRFKALQDNKVTACTSSSKYLKEQMRKHDRAGSVILCITNHCHKRIDCEKMLKA